MSVHASNPSLSRALKLHIRGIRSLLDLSLVSLSSQVSTKSLSQASLSYFIDKIEPKILGGISSSNQESSRSNLAHGRVVRSCVVEC